jgi:histidine triad (HIT) family protein
MAMFTITQRVACALRKSGLPCEGVNLFLADGEAAMQEVFHVHLHAIPRFAGDGFGLKFPTAYGQKPARASLDATAERIRAALNKAPNQSSDSTTSAGTSAAGQPRVPASTASQL